MRQRLAQFIGRVNLLILGPERYEQLQARIAENKRVTAEYNRQTAELEEEIKQLLALIKRLEKEQK